MKPYFPLLLGTVWAAICLVVWTVIARILRAEPSHRTGSLSSETASETPQVHQASIRLCRLLAFSSVLVAGILIILPTVAVVGKFVVGQTEGAIWIAYSLIGFFMMLGLALLYGLSKEDLVWKSSDSEANK